MTKHLPEHVSVHGATTFLGVFKTQRVDKPSGPQPHPPRQQPQPQGSVLGWLSDEEWVAGVFFHPQPRASSPSQQTVAFRPSADGATGKKAPRKRPSLALVPLALLLAMPGSAPLAISSADAPFSGVPAPAALSGIPALPEEKSPFGLSAASFTPEEPTTPVPLIVVAPLAGEALAQVAEASPRRTPARAEGEELAPGETAAPAPIELAEAAAPAFVHAASEVATVAAEASPAPPSEGAPAATQAAPVPVAEAAPFPVNALEAASTPEAAAEAPSTDPATLALVQDLEARVEALAASNVELASKLEQALALPPPVPTEMPPAPRPSAVPTGAAPSAAPQPPVLPTVLDYLSEQVALGLLADTPLDAGLERTASGEVLELRGMLADGEIVKTVRLGPSGPEMVLVAAVLEHPAGETAAALEQHLQNLYGHPQSGPEGLSWTTGRGTVRLQTAGDALTLTFLRRYASTFGFGN